MNRIQVQDFEYITKSQNEGKLISSRTRILVLLRIVEQNRLMRKIRIEINNKIKDYQY